ncbi:unnamed protein product, partial [Acidithrix sp. C25]
VRVAVANMVVANMVVDRYSSIFRGHGPLVDNLEVTQRQK